MSRIVYSSSVFLKQITYVRDSLPHRRESRLNATDYSVVTTGGCGVSTDPDGYFSLRPVAEHGHDITRCRPQFLVHRDTTDEGSEVRGERSGHYVTQNSCQSRGGSSRDREYLPPFRFATLHRCFKGNFPNLDSRVG